MEKAELLRAALQDAITLQHALVKAHGGDTVAGMNASLRASQYRDLLERDYSVPYTLEETRRGRADRALVKVGTIR